MLGGEVLWKTRHEEASGLARLLGWEGYPLEPGAVL